MPSRTPKPPAPLPYRVHAETVWPGNGMNRALATEVTITLKVSNWLTRAFHTPGIAKIVLVYEDDHTTTYTRVEQ